MTTKRLEPIHPGEILEEKFMRPLGLSANALARRIDVPADRLWLFPDAGSCAGINCSGVLP